MKAVCFIAIMLFVLFTVSSASAEDQAVTLTDENSNIEVNEHLELPDGLLGVTVTYNPSTGVLKYQYTGPTSYDPNNPRPYITNPKIDEIGYNLNINGAVSSSSGGPWALANGNSRMDGFGSFMRDYTTDGKNVARINSVTVTLDQAQKPFPSFPSTGNAVAVHLAFDGAYDAHNQPVNVPPYITLSKGGLSGGGSSYLAGEVNQIPEFPTMALPVAAILGLLFITQRRKEN